MAKKAIIFMLLILTSVTGNTAMAADGERLLADFIYNLVDHVQWKERDEITVCSYGYDDVSLSLSQIDTSNVSRLNKLLNINKVEILNHVSLDETLQCNLLYVGEDKEKDLLRLFDTIEGSSVITISKIENFVDKGGVLEFKLSRRKVRLKLGSSALQKTGIDISPTILMSVRPNVLKNCPNCT